MIRPPWEGMAAKLGMSTIRLEVVWAWLALVMLMLRSTQDGLGRATSSWHSWVMGMRRGCSTTSIRVLAKPGREQSTGSSRRSREKVTLAGLPQLDLLMELRCCRCYHDSTS